MNPNSPAFPQHPETETGEPVLTVRACIAMHIAAGIAGAWDFDRYPFSVAANRASVADDAALLADALIERLNRP